MSKKNPERAARWVSVEALCLCARLERERGTINDLMIRRYDGPPAVIEEALRLVSRDQDRTQWRSLWRAAFEWPTRFVARAAGAGGILVAYVLYKHR